MCDVCRAASKLSWTLSSVGGIQLSCSFLVCWADGCRECLCFSRRTSGQIVFFVVYHRSALCCYVPLTRVAVHVRFPFLVRPAFCDGFAQTASTTSLFSDMQRSFSCLDRVATATVVAVVSYADAGGSLQRRPLPTAPLAVVAPYPSMLSWRAGCASPARWAPGDFEPGWDAPGPRQTAACAGFSAGARSSVVF